MTQASRAGVWTGEEEGAGRVRVMSLGGARWRWCHLHGRRRAGRFQKKMTSHSGGGQWQKEDYS